MSNLNISDYNMIMKATQQSCHCGSGKKYKLCCQPFIDHKRLAPTPEALMRSRYSAYVKKDFAYIKDTATGPAQQNFDENSVRTRMDQVTWLNLQILHVSSITPTDTIGFVEFIARFSQDGTEESLHEISEFHKKDKKWYYFDGKFPK